MFDRGVCFIDIGKYEANIRLVDTVGLYSEGGYLFNGVPGRWESAYYHFGCRVLHGYGTSISKRDFLKNILLLVR